MILPRAELLRSWRVAAGAPRACYSHDTRFSHLTPSPRHTHRQAETQTGTGDGSRGLGDAWSREPPWSSLTYTARQVATDTSEADPRRWRAGREA